MYAILLARLTRGRAEDLVQDVFVTALEHLPSLREPAAFPGWIAAIARRRAADEHRRPAFRSDIDDPGPALASAVSPHASADVHLDAKRALEAIGLLPEAYRETLVLRLVQGLTGPEIAELTGLSPDSVRVNLHRGFRLLRIALRGGQAS